MRNKESIKNCGPEVWYGEYGQPFGLKTMLGWTLLGAETSSDQAKNECDCRQAIHVNFVAQCKAPDDCEEVLQGFNGDFMDVKIDYRVRSSVEDKQAQRMMEDTIVKVDKHYQVGLPWRSEDCKLLNNKKLAARRLDYMIRRFQSDPELFDIYKEKI